MQLKIVLTTVSLGLLGIAVSGCVSEGGDYYPGYSSSVVYSTYRTDDDYRRRYRDHGDRYRDSYYRDHYRDSYYRDRDRDHRGDGRDRYDRDHGRRGDRDRDNRRGSSDNSERHGSHDHNKSGSMTWSQARARAAANPQNNSTSMDGGTCKPGQHDCATRDHK